MRAASLTCLCVVGFWLEIRGVGGFVNPCNVLSNLWGSHPPLTWMCSQRCLNGLPKHRLDSLGHHCIWSAWFSLRHTWASSHLYAGFSSPAHPKQPFLYYLQWMSLGVVVVSTPTQKEPRVVRKKIRGHVAGPPILWWHSLLLLSLWMSEEARSQATDIVDSMRPSSFWSTAVPRQTQSVNGWWS